MAIRFHRSLKILPGVRLNLGKRGIGLSAGIRGFHVGIDSRGRPYTSAGIPGTGLSVRTTAKRDDSGAYQSAIVIGILIGLAFVVVLAIIGLFQS